MDMLVTQHLLNPNADKCHPYHPCLEGSGIEMLGLSPLQQIKECKSTAEGDCWGEGTVD